MTKLKRSASSKGDGKSEKQCKTEHVVAKSAEELLKAAKKAINSASELRGLSFQDLMQWSQRTGVSIPWPAGYTPSRDFIASETAKQYTFELPRPGNVAIAGSFMLQTALNSSSSEHPSNIDMVVEAPEGVLFRFDAGEKDHLNWKYWTRRSAWLAWIMAALQSSFDTDTESVKLSYGQLHGNPYKSVIELRMAFDSRVIRIIPAIPLSEALKSKAFRLSPLRNNVRAAFLKEWSGRDFSQRTEELPPTPFHNYSLLSEALYIPHLIHLHTVLAGKDNLISAVKLVKAFLAKWSPVSLGTGGLNGFLATIWIVDLVKKGVVVPAVMDEFQIFKTVLKSWIETFQHSSEQVSIEIFTDSALDVSFSEPGSNKATVPSSPVSEVVFNLGGMNLAYQCGLAALKALARRAETVLSFLTAHPTRIDRVFLEDKHNDSNGLIASWDLEIRIGSFNAQDLSPFLPAGIEADWIDPVASGYLEARIEKVLKKGLTDRITGPIAVKLRAGSNCELSIGAMLNPLEAGRLVDQGPLTDDKAEAARFRGFWGTKAELRQFVDASVRESVVWESLSSRRDQIPGAIVEHLLKRHFGWTKAQVWISTELAAALPEQVRDSLGTAFSQDESAFRSAFELLSRELRGLGASGHLPLTIVQVAGLSDADRGTSAINPRNLPSMRHNGPSATLPAGVPALSVPHEVLVRFERSSAWPDELQALQISRTAFLLQLQRVLKVKGLATDSLLAAAGYLDVPFRGFLFRLWLDIPRESLRCRSEGLLAEAKVIEERNWWKPKVSAALSQLNARFPAFGAACKIMKHFLAGHLFAPSDVPELFIEICVAAAFLPGPEQSGDATCAVLCQDVPGCGWSGFLRSLDFIATFPWLERPFVLDLSSLASPESSDSLEEHDSATGLSDEDSKTLTAGIDWSLLARNASIADAIVFLTAEQRALAASALRSSDPARMTLQLPRIPWMPSSKAVLVRLRVLARASLAHVATRSSEAVAGLFTVGEAIRSDFDLLVKLDPQQVMPLPMERTVLGLARILRDAPQPNTLLFSALPGFNPSQRLVQNLSEPLSRLNATIHYNPANPVIIAVRIRDATQASAVTDCVQRVGGDLILDMKMTH